ncbi:alpha/beta hydrolase (plasmid) [Cupriavidus pinatubonensis]|uniref:alpha/beta fold hydrolase n=1 Tax=Cupriavidus pinatubonensis TaxID=248026 RepID=UPI001C72AE4A|nr:alpha/beta hydrolase [Cupriavidus pinatubonensis]QYY34268.1 alpha/beta hydrolase [Cupriavidus pinatubonensis]
MTTKHKVRSALQITAAAGAAALVATLLIGSAHAAAPQPATPDIGFVQVNPDIKLRRLVVHNAAPRGTVLFLHGFPETLYAWKDIASTLGQDYEVHAFDWPGYGESSRPGVDKFAYAPSDYAKVLKDYIATAGIDKQHLVIYATDIGALPALLAALDEPAIAKRIIVGDFAPFNRPQFMQERLQALKDPATADAVHAAFNRTRDEILQNAFTRGLPESLRYEVTLEFKADIVHGWQNGALTSADAFYQYYSHFTHDQDHFEANLGKLTTPVSVIWGEKDIYIHKEMGEELAGRAKLDMKVLPGLGHYPHLQDQAATISEVRAAFGAR